MSHICLNMETFFPSVHAGEIEPAYRLKILPLQDEHGNNTPPNIHYVMEFVFTTHHYSLATCCNISIAGSRAALLDWVQHLHFSHNNVLIITSVNSISIKTLSFLFYNIIYHICSMRSAPPMAFRFL